MERNYVHIYYGYGKGKSTAAAGLALRAKGAGKSVLIAQFLKDGTSSETKLFQDNGIHFIYDENCKGFYAYMQQDEQLCCKGKQLALLDKASASMSHYDIVILDEFLDLADVGIISRETAESIVAGARCELVITGHKIWEGLTDLADYVTHFDCRKHPYNKGLEPRRGIEF